MEIERKFLVASLPQNLEQYQATEIAQAYLCSSPTLRVRKAGDAFILTVKEKPAKSATADCQTASGKERVGETSAKMAPLVSREEEFLLTEDTFNHLLQKCDGLVVRKTRYRIPLQDSLVAELDIFHAPYEGLRIVEVEFPSEEASFSFIPPDWFGADVSLDPQYRNTSLAFPESNKKPHKQ